METFFSSFTSFTGKGQKDIQQDRCYVDDNFMIVCDGMGGRPCGEKAAQICLDLCKDHFEKQKDHSIYNTEDHLFNLLSSIKQSLSDFESLHPACKKLSTTLSIVALNEIQFSAHMGDSPIVIFNDTGMIKFKSKDHSIVQELIDKKAITVEEAHTHPMKNAISRIIEGNSNHFLDIHYLNNLSNGDWVLVGSDGIFEAIHENDISSMIKQGNNLNQISDAIMNLCSENSFDNFSATIGKISKK